jgi:hypothetical protein
MYVGLGAALALLAVRRVRGRSAEPSVDERRRG